MGTGKEKPVSSNDLRQAIKSMADIKAKPPSNAEILKMAKLKRSKRKRK